MGRTKKADNRVLHIAIADPKQRVEESPLRGMVYDPQKVYAPNSGKSARAHFEAFFRIGREYQVVPIKTAKSPMEVVDALQTDYDADAEIHVCGVLSGFRVTKEQSRKLARDLWVDPLLYGRNTE
jgi:hypothetical protein